MLLYLPFQLQAQTVRPIPYPVIPSKSFQEAVERGTRTLTGEPGPNYWMNSASYHIAATLSPDTRQLRGWERVVYRNQSPDTLHMLVFHLRQNLHQEGNIRNRTVTVTGGMPVSVVHVQGQTLLEYRRLRQPGYRIDGTRMYIRLPQAVAPGDSVEIKLAWSFEVPPVGNPRMGQDGEVFYLGYWYPQLAVYDDLHGWKADPYMANGEFYMGYADYNVFLTVPEGWLIAATGELQNAEEVLTEEVRQRLARAMQTDSVVHVVTEEERQPGRSTVVAPSGMLTWHFKAYNVRDFAWGTSNRYVWDATRARVGDRDGDGKEDYAAIYAFYRPDRTVWQQSARFARFSIEFLSRHFLPYPWPHMTTVEGIIRGGMEYPMITLIGGNRTERSLFRVTFHEIGHMWFPMMVGQDEKTYAWMDEGLTTFNTNEGTVSFFPDADPWNPAFQSYYFIAGTDDEVEIMRHADLYPPGTPARVVASYGKPALVLHALRNMVGEEAFWRAYRTYARRWAFKHPTPYDLFHTFEDVLDRNLDWFWTSWFFETWTLDQAIAEVRVEGDRATVVVEDKGLVPMPVVIEATFENGNQVRETIPVDVWLKGARSTEIVFQGRGLTAVAIDPDFAFPDVNRSNNYWSKKEEQ